LNGNAQRCKLTPKLGPGADAPILERVATFGSLGTKISVAVLVVSFVILVGVSIPAWLGIRLRHAAGNVVHSRWTALLGVEVEERREPACAESSGCT